MPIKRTPMGYYSAQWPTETGHIETSVYLPLDPRDDNETYKKYREDFMANCKTHEANFTVRICPA